MEVKLVSCNLCGADDFSTVHESTLDGKLANVEDYVGTNPGYGKFHTLVKCHRCGLVYMNPRDGNIPALLSAVEDPDYLSSWKERAETFQEHLKIIKPLKSSGKLLDVGCYAGIFLEVAQQEGYTVEGVEPSRWASDYARSKLSVPIHHQRLEDMILDIDSYDIVSLWDVIEHLEDPKTCLEKVFRALKPGGVLAVSTHNIDSLFARIAGKRYPWLMRFHLYHFSPKTLAQMAEHVGFQVLRVNGYKKRMPLNYILKRLGLPFTPSVFKNVKITLNMGDMFVLIGEKKT